MTDFIDQLSKELPSELKLKTQVLPVETLALFDTLLRFALGSECPSGDAVSHGTRQSWPTQQQQFLSHIQGHRVEKRLREDLGDGFEGINGDGEGEQSKKKRKLGIADVDADDEHVFTLNSLSVSSPIRKKVDIAIYKKSLRLLNPSTHAVEFSILLTDLKRAFLIPTRGKSKPHWSVVLLASDTPAPAKGKDVSKASNSNEQVQLVFGVDAVPTAAYTTSEGSHPRGTPIFPFLRSFLSHLPPHISVTEVGLEEEQSQAKGVQAYRRAKEGTLWFLSGGVLWDGKPCEFWDISDLIGNVPGGEEGDVNGPTMTGAEGVRVVSATGRTCSVFLRRQILPLQKDGNEDEEREREKDEEEEQAIQVEETDFGMIEGKEQDGILQWVKRNKRQFGKPKQQQDNVGAPGVDVKGKGKAVALPEEDSDEEDSDFHSESDSDGGSPTSGSDSDSDDEAGTVDEEESGEDDSEEELDPSRHPLLRPGAMPKMSKAAIEAAVGMVTSDVDLLGAGSGTSGGRPMDVDDDDEEDNEAEEDELED
ncbi:hypothetical protein BDY19DRAFT_237671 [Irpex rosettiformis]|uniref:Uncharacterized protein n=1 Tax=Irpex rosettiformis TaxID=378272 RepID=A0ACB8TZR5_9APHY|nr:hypothetical protein BDY19DRAFT_237671 [Irpex rosettiformis]